MIEDAIKIITDGKPLDYGMAEKVMNEIMNGEATQAQISSYLTALHIKGETIEEITASAAVMRAHCTKFTHNGEVLEIVGTGGDCANTINISTLASIIVSANGVKVAKHGNRAASSKCGTADVLEALGVKLDVTPERNSEILDNVGMCFLFAQKYHSAMRFVAGVRKEIKIPTVFNILGSLANPAFAEYQLLGVYDERLVKPLAQVLSRLGVKRGMVVYGQDRLDEISISAPTVVCEFENGEFKDYVIEPEKYGITRGKKEELAGGTPAENAEFARKVLSGEKGSKRDAVILNAAAALHVATGVTLEGGIRIAADTIDSGKALKQLEKLIAETNKQVNAIA